MRQITNKKKLGVALSISDKVDFGKRNIARDKRRTVYNSKRSIFQDDTTIRHVYATNKRASKYNM